MPRHFQDLKLQPEKLAPRRGLDQEIRLAWFHFQAETVVLEKVRIGDHRDGVGVTTDRATEPLFDLRHVRDVIEVAMREQEQCGRDLAALQPGAHPVRGVEKDRPLRAPRRGSSLSQKFPPQKVS